MRVLLRLVPDRFMPQWWKEWKHCITILSILHKIWMWAQSNLAGKSLRESTRLANFQSGDNDWLLPKNSFPIWQRRRQNTRSSQTSQHTNSQDDSRETNSSSLYEITLVPLVKNTVGERNTSAIKLSQFVCGGISWNSIKSQIFERYKSKCIGTAIRDEMTCGQFETSHQLKLRVLSRWLSWNLSAFPSRRSLSVENNNTWLDKFNQPIGSIGNLAGIPRINPKFPSKAQYLEYTG